MKDIVRILQEYAVSQGWVFAYGSDAHINLIESDMDKEKIYFLLFPVTRTTKKERGNCFTKEFVFSGKFLLVKPSDFSMQYFNEAQCDDAESKYSINIEPLLDLHSCMYDALICLDIECSQWDCVDACDVLDANKDGLWCTFKIIKDGNKANITA